jgi:NAD(P)H dehydrogenase (quinone)
MILVTGATGHLGGSVIRHLLKGVPADQIIALVRDESKAIKLKDYGIPVRIGDYHHPASLSAAFKSVDKILLISSNDYNDRFGQHKNVIDAARTNGVSRVVYTGVSLRNVNGSVLYSHMRDHFLTEDYLEASGMNYTFMRHNLYAEMIPFYLGNQVLEKGIVFPAGNGRIPFALRDEMGEANANILINQGHENKSYNIANETAWSFQDMADILSELAGKQVSYTNPDHGSYIDSLKAAGLPELKVRAASLFSAAMRNGDFMLPGNELKSLLGRKPTDLKTYLQQTYHKKQAG